MACFGLVTFSPLELRNLPSFIAFIPAPTFALAPGEYFVPELFFAAVFLAGGLAVVAFLEADFLTAAVFTALFFAGVLFAGVFVAAVFLAGAFFAALLAVFFAVAMRHLDEQVAFCARSLRCTFYGACATAIFVPERVVASATTSPLQRMPHQ